MRGPEALAAPVPLGVTDAVWASCGPQAVRIEIASSTSPARTGQWYGRDPSGVRRGGGTGRRVGLKNRCPQGRPGSTPGLGTTRFQTPAHRLRVTAVVEGRNSSPRAGKYRTEGRGWGAGGS